MPFKSEKQRRYMFMAHPDIAHKWAHGKHSAKTNHKMPKTTKRKHARRGRR